MEVKKLDKNHYVKRGSAGAKVKVLEVPIVISPATTRELSLNMAIEKWTKASASPGTHNPSGSFIKRDPDAGKLTSVRGEKFPGKADQKFK